MKNNGLAKGGAITGICLASLVALILFIVAGTGGFVTSDYDLGTADKVMLGTEIAILVIIGFLEVGGVVICILILTLPNLSPQACLGLGITMIFLVLVAGILITVAAAVQMNQKEKSSQ